MSPPNPARRLPRSSERATGVQPTGPRLSPSMSLAPLSSSWPHCRSLFLSNFPILFEMKKIFQGVVLPSGHARAFHQDHCQTVRQVLILEMPMLLSDILKAMKYLPRVFYPWVQTVGENKTSHLLLMSALTQ